MTNNSNLVEYRSRLMALRDKVGAESEAGGHISNLVEQLINYEQEYDQDVRARLEKFMSASVKAIDALIHPNGERK